jgi:hypothetical protein
MLSMEAVGSTRIGVQLEEKGAIAMRASRRVLAIIGVLTGLTVGCATKPPQSPRILNSVSPVGAPPAPPLDSTRPVVVPQAPLGAPTATTVVPAAPTVVAPQTLVPLQPGVAAPGAAPTQPQNTMPSLGAPQSATSPAGQPNASDPLRLQMQPYSGGATQNP